eukprot:Clim_evm46s128 gene=Clim_evmTU46s128
MSMEDRVPLSDRTNVQEFEDYHDALTTWKPFYEKARQQQQEMNLENSDNEEVAVSISIAGFNDDHYDEQIVPEHKRTDEIDYEQPNQMSAEVEVVPLPENDLPVPGAQEVFESLESVFEVDTRPVHGVNNRSFEEYVEDVLKEVEQPAEPTTPSDRKRPFLRKGSGNMARYGRLGAPKFKASLNDPATPSPVAKQTKPLLATAKSPPARTPMTHRKVAPHKPADSMAQPAIEIRMAPSAAARMQEQQQHQDAKDPGMDDSNAVDLSIMIENDRDRESKAQELDEFMKLEQMTAVSGSIDPPASAMDRLRNVLDVSGSSELDANQEQEFQFEDAPANENKRQQLSSSPNTSAISLDYQSSRYVQPAKRVNFNLSPDMHNYSDVSTVHNESNEGDQMNGSAPVTIQQQGLPQAMELDSSKAPVPPSPGLVQSKIAELDREIDKFKRENAQLSQMRREHDAELRAIRREMEVFEHAREKEIREVEEWREAEVARVRRELKKWERMERAKMAIPPKSEREAIEKMKSDMHRMREDFATKDTKRNLAMQRYRDEISQLRDELTEYKRALERSEAESDTLKRRLSETEQQLKAQTIEKSVAKPVHAPVVATEEHWLPETSHNGRTVVEKHYRTGNKAAASATVQQPAEPLMASSATVAPQPHVSAAEVTGPVPDMQEEVCEDGTRIVMYANGTKKETDPKGNVTVYYFNGDIKQTMPDGMQVYYFSETEATHTTHPDGLVVLHFANNQVEKHYPNGTKEIMFPDSTIKFTYPEGSEVSIVINS